MQERQIMLVPREHFWDWVKAARNYVLTFGTTITPDPNNAGRYMAPNQTITIVLPPNGYPAQGDIRAWFVQHYPGVRLDVIEVNTPEELENVLAQRIAALDRYGDTTRPFRLLWPTDYAVITQPFGAHPEIYSQWGLPGHEGVDFRAPTGSNVYAAADGVVYRVEPQPVGAYGRQVRVRHRAGYKTVYAHLDEVLVANGDFVKAGQIIGKADNTGNSYGSHLHLTLKHEGATERGETNYPYDIIDPTPFLVWPGTEEAIRRAQYGWGPGHGLVGAACRPDGQFGEADFSVVKNARLEAVRITQATPDEALARLRQINPNIFVLARLTADMRTRKFTGAEFADALRPQVARFYAQGIRYFEIHTQPNLHVNGWMVSWTDGASFGAWFLQVLNAWRQQFPEAKFGFPALSPGDDVPNQRFAAARFLDQADQAALAADWLGAACYWSLFAEMNRPEGGRCYETLRLRYPHKLIFVTDFANVNRATDDDIRGDQYVSYYRYIYERPGIGAAFADYLTPGDAASYLGWSDAAGHMSVVVTKVANRGW